MSKKYLITTGDPNGIGPEIILKAAKLGYLKNCVVIGSNEVFKYYEDILKTGVTWSIDPENSNADFYLYDIDFKYEIEPGKCNADGGLFSIKCLDKAIELLKQGFASHLITAPLSKKAVSNHVPNFIGHTEYLAEAFDTKSYSMMLANETFRVVLVTTHVSILNLPKEITKDKVKFAVRNSFNFLKSVNDERGIAVCALNPHAGENGLLGTEEIDIIIPALDELKNEGIEAEGPFPADSLFKTVYSNPYGIYIAMYHDQGLGPLKMVSKGRGVNITLGLPIFRISVDHGTAYDISGKNIADPLSLIEAIEIAKKVNL